MELDAQQIDKGLPATEPNDIAGKVEPKQLSGSSLEGIYDIPGGPDTLADRYRRQGWIRSPLALVQDGCAIPDDVHLRELREFEELIDHTMPPWWLFGAGSLVNTGWG